MNFRGNLPALPRLCLDEQYVGEANPHELL